MNCCVCATSNNFNCDYVRACAAKLQALSGNSSNSNNKKSNCTRLLQRFLLATSLLHVFLHFILIFRFFSFIYFFFRNCFCFLLPLASRLFLRHQMLAIFRFLCQQCRLCGKMLHNSCKASESHVCPSVAPFVCRLHRICNSCAKIKTKKV